LSPVFVKICGLSTPSAVEAAVLGGADAVGFVFADSPRRVTPKRARALCADVPEVVLRVAVMRHPTRDEWQAVLDDFAPDWLQTDAADLTGLEVPEHVGCLPVFRDAGAIDTAALPLSEPFLFEAADSGAGQRPDWVRAAALAANRQLVLAGGLDPDNVGAAIDRVRPFGVDVSSGVEARRGVKDVRRIAEFLAAVRRAERAHAD
jgi:phosphoribosylanthranilate isomerase